jgi:hypothetical protein
MRAIWQSILFWAIFVVALLTIVTAIVMVARLAAPLEVAI